MSPSAGSHSLSQRRYFAMACSDRARALPLDTASSVEQARALLRAAVHRGRPLFETLMVRAERIRANCLRGMASGGTAHGLDAGIQNHSLTVARNLIHDRARSIGGRRRRRVIR